MASAEPIAAGIKKSFLIGLLLLAAAGLVTTVAVLFFRRADSRSLISRSMHDK
jgi:hypothetical protein